MSNEQCEPILDMYVSRAFQWYKECHKPLNFDPCNRSLKFRESTGTSSPKVGVALRVWGFIPSYSFALLTLSGVCDVIPGLFFVLGFFLARTFAASLPWLPGSFLPATLQPLCLGREAKARVATAKVPNGGNVGSTNPWDSSKPNRDKKDFLHCWNFHCTSEVSFINQPPQLDDFCEQKLAYWSKGWVF
jgi:hypothetical protein